MPLFSGPFLKRRKALLHGGQAMPYSYAAHTGRRNKHALFAQLIADPHLAVTGNSMAKAVTAASVASSM